MSSFLHLKLKCNREEHNEWKRMKRRKQRRLDGTKYIVKRKKT